MYPGASTSWPRIAHHDSSGCGAMPSQVLVISVQTSFARRSGAAWSRISRSAHAASSATSAYRPRTATDPATDAPPGSQRRCQAGSAVSSEMSSASASVSASESGQSANAGRVRIPAMWIACPVSWMSSVSSPRPPSVHVSRIVGRPVVHVPSALPVRASVERRVRDRDRRPARPGVDVEHDAQLVEVCAERRMHGRG